MRLIGTINNEKQGRAFSNFLQRAEIPNQCEINVNTDWGSNDYGNVSCKIWVIDEDQYNKGLEFLNDFNQNPDDPRFYDTTPPLEALIEPEDESEVIMTATNSHGKKSLPVRNSMGTWTLYLIIVCGWIFIWGQITSPPNDVYEKMPQNLPAVPILEPPINKKLIYDYPYAYEIVDRLIALYGLENAANPSALPPEGKYLFETYLHTKYWEGLYSYIVTSIIEKKPLKQYIDTDIPMFEKIRAGEVWRAFTPCLLHANFLHILFNLIWLVVLGKQMEMRLGGAKYLLFILVAGIIPNTAQYLMSGSNFIGISGVVAAMFGFIWMRQKYAAWEGYQLQRGTIGFILFFFGIMLAIQLLSFVTEITWKVSISPGIANTAHIVGVIVGILFGRSKYFSWNQIS